MRNVVEIFPGATQDFGHCGEIMENKRAKEVADECAKITNNTVFLRAAITKYLETLPEFQKPESEWVNPREQLPGNGQDINIVIRSSHIVYPGWRSADSEWYTPFDTFKDAQVFRWCPRSIPVPPPFEPEESPCIKDLRRLSTNPDITDVILIVKRHEQKGK